MVLTNDAAVWLDAVRTAHVDYDAIIFGTHHTLRHADNRYAEPYALMAAAYADSRVPLFAFWDFFVGSGMERWQIELSTLTASQTFFID